MAFPQTSAPTLSNFQYSLNGLTMGQGTPFQFTQVDGLDFPNVSTADLARPRSHGEFIGMDFLSGRDITLTGDIVSDGTSLQDALYNLGAATQPGVNIETPLWIQLPNLPALASMIRVRKRTTPLDVGYVGGLASLALQVHATDPRLYTSAQSVTTTPIDPAGGLTFNATFDALFPSSGGGPLVINNTGNTETFPILTISGYCNSPTISNASTGWSLSLLGLTINTGDHVTIDLQTHSVKYFDGTNPNGLNIRGAINATTVWPNSVTGINALAPGNNTIDFTTLTNTGSLSVTYSSAYIL